MGIQVEWYRNLDIIIVVQMEIDCCVAQRFPSIRTMGTRLKPLYKPLSTQEFTAVFRTPFDACVPLIFRAHFCAAI